MAARSSAKRRLMALVGPIAGERRAVHTSGYPLDLEKMLPVADVLLLIEDAQRSAMLFRYTAFGEFGGDTLHMSVAEAQEQANFEYGSALLAWLEVPEEITDAHHFAVQYAAEQLNQRGE